ncbi:signal transduction histidine kinase [Prauserella shujinwangii]|uniref:histidine kinase n=1 Tax=Prauserella shujinwangii TaxID=1453103 RepID=A0A2T0LKW3_9PSEU|nr:histidine kinase [Prauserella shujinwangii]PRX43600.1 signal transduction histidine kinase [Prauserella shujinwangii]
MNERGRRRLAVLVDVGVWLAVCAVCGYETRENAAPWELLGGLAATTVAMATARRHPLLSLTVASASALAVLFNYLGRYPVWPVLLMVAAGYFAGRRMDHARPAVLTFAGVALAGMPVAYALSADAVGNWATLVLTLLFAVFVPWHLGRYTRLRDDLVRTGWDRARQAEERRRHEAERARLRERARIASDMHDSLGHELSLLALRAGALEVAADLGERHRAAAGELRAGAAAATERLREIIGVLREDAAPTEPADAAVADLVRRAADSGLAVGARIDQGTAPPMVERAAYRVVQEALTNVAKHAPGAAVTVDVRRSADQTCVTVRNTRPPAGPLPGATSGQRGLVGLRERVRLVGGSLRSGECDGGFQVVAWLPHGAAPVAADSGDGGTDSARELALARRRVRWTLVNALVVPVVVVAVLAAVSTVYYSFNQVSSVLEPEVYARLRVGQPQDEVEALLPSQQRLSHDPDAWGTPPEGADCRVYGADATLIGSSPVVYRLCFAGGRLVAKESFDERRERGETG